MTTTRPRPTTAALSPHPTQRAAAATDTPQRPHQSFALAPVKRSTWARTATVGESGRISPNGWAALLSTSGATTALTATRGTTHLALGSGVTVFAWAPPSRTPVPVLGAIWTSNQDGYGLPHPDRYFNGGDPTGAVTQIHWNSWGGPTALGTGRTPYVTTTVAAAPIESAQVEAFDLGLCDGVLMYRRVEAWHPQHGESFNPDPASTYDLCNGLTP